MDHLLGFITLNGLLSLNIEEVQPHLNSVQWPNTSNQRSFNVFYSEMRAIFLISVSIDAFLQQPLLLRCIASQAKNSVNLFEQLLWINPVILPRHGLHDLFPPPSPISNNNPANDNLFNHDFMIKYVRVCNVR